MLHSTGNSQETARLYALGSGIILVEIRALDDNDPDIARMGVCIPASNPGTNLVKVAWAPLFASPQIAAMETPLVGVS